MNFLMENYIYILIAVGVICIFVNIVRLVRSKQKVADVQNLLLQLQNENSEISLNLLESKRIEKNYKSNKFISNNPEYIVSGVYAITNKNSRRYYIGRSQNILTAVNQTVGGRGPIVVAKDIQKNRDEIDIIIYPNTESRTEIETYLINKGYEKY